MKNTKNKVCIKSAKQRAKSPKKSDQPILLSIGKLDLIYKIDFTDADLEIVDEDSNNNQNNEDKVISYYRIEDFNAISDLQFLRNKKEIWKKIQLIPNNHTLKQLLLATKTTKQKYFIEYISFGRPVFKDDEKFFEEIYNFVNEKNCLYVNKVPICPGSSFSLRFEFTHKGNSHFFDAESEDKTKRNEKKEEKKEENNVNEKDNENQEKIEKEKENENAKQQENNYNNNNYEENKATKEQKIPKFSRQYCAFSNMEPLCAKYDLFYINYEDMLNFPGDYKTKDLIELAYFFKKKGCKTFINFYKPKEETNAEEVEIKEEADCVLKKENFNSGANNFNIHETEDAEQDEKDDDNENEDEESEMKLLNNLYYVIECYFFDTKQAISSFDEHYQYFRNDKKEESSKKNKIDRRKVYDYFIKGIAPGTKEEVAGNKFGFFMDNFVKYVIINCNKKKAKKMEFDCQLYPKINHNNIELIDEYKQIIENNKDDYIFIFIAFLLGGIVVGKGITTESILTSFLNAIEIIKRKVECTKNNVKMSEENVMKFKLSEKAVAEEIKKLTAGDQESGFILDCVNKEKSSLKDYVALYDYHLSNYLSSSLIQKELINKGFIDDDGFVMYDKEHREVMGIPLATNKDKKNDNIEKKVLNSIRQIDVSCRITDKELDSKRAALKLNSATHRKIPGGKINIQKKNNKKVGMEKKGNK